MKANCMICGREDDTYWMKEISTGRARQYICYECEKLGRQQCEAAELTKHRHYKKKKPGNK